MTADSASVRIFQPPNRLKSKVGRGRATLPPTVPPAFEALVHASTAAYSTHLEGQLRTLRELAAANGELPVEPVFTLAHQIRGEAKTFGFACVGSAANSLCTFCEAGGHSRARGAAVVVLHIDTMIILKSECDTHGAAAAVKRSQSLSDGLAQAVRHVLRSIGEDSKGP